MRAKPLLILLNGPPGAGKDTAGRAIAAKVPNARVMKFARRLKESVHADYGFPSLPHDAFEAVKDEPNAAFFGKTPRQAYITKSESMVKPVLGDDFYGRVFLRDMMAEAALGAEAVVVTDSGFAIEAMPAVRHVGRDRVLLLRVRAEGRRKTFAGDSRGYIRIPGVACVDVHNDGDEDDFRAVVLDVVEDWISEAARGDLPLAED